MPYTPAASCLTIHKPRQPNIFSWGDGKIQAYHKDLEKSPTNREMSMRIRKPNRPNLSLYIPLGGFERKRGRSRLRLGGVQSSVLARDKPGSAESRTYLVAKERCRSSKRRARQGERAELRRRFLQNVVEGSCDGEIVRMRFDDGGQCAAPLSLALTSTLLSHPRLSKS